MQPDVRTRIIPPVSAHVVSRLRLVACLIGSLLLAPAVRAQTVSVDFDKDADFTRIKRYQWRTHPTFEKRPDLKEKYSVAIQLVLETGNEQLMKKGLQPVDRAPDVFATFFIVAEDEQEVRTVDQLGPWWGTPYGWYGTAVWTTTTIENYKAGMLILDFVDAHTSKLIWRAYCSDTIRDMRTRDKNIDAAVRKALDRLPLKRK